MSYCSETDDYHNHDWEPLQDMQKRSVGAKKVSYGAAQFQVSTASSHPLSAKISIPPNAPPFHDFLQILAIEGGVQDVYTIFDTFSAIFQLDTD